ncbi:MAG: cytochrome c [Gammaproteobacteria bacterium]|nr:cytochrome c [Gammaproteobacteria bacterium]
MKRTKQKRPLAAFLLLLILALLVGAGSAFAKGSIAAGAQKTRTCQVCHGKGGHSTNSAYPVLAGQHAKYIRKQLRAFRAGTRKDPIMNGMAAPLSDQDIEDVAAFFESNAYPAPQEAP